MAKRWKTVEWGDKGERKRTTTWNDPLKWNRAAEKAGERRRVFCASLADVFEDKPELVRWRDELFALIDATPWLDWLLLTKRPENIKRMWPLTDAGLMAPFPGMPGPLGQPLPATKRERRNNVWLGTSCGHSDSLMRIPQLLKCRSLSPVLFLSAEPLLERINLTCIEAPPEMQRYSGQGLAANALMPDDEHFYEFDGHLDWVIVGGESGPQARPCDIGWIRSIVKQCRDAEVPCFVKQLGSVPLMTVGGQHTADGTRTIGPGEFWKIKDLKGGNPEEWPEDLRIREFPEGDR